MQYSLIKHPRLKHIARLIESEESSLPWISLYSTQALLDQLQDADLPLEDIWMDILLALNVGIRKGQLSLCLKAFWCARKQLLLDEFKISSESELIKRISLSSIVHQTLNNDANEARSVKPIVLVDGKLYLKQFWDKKRYVENWIGHRVNEPLRTLLPTTASALNAILKSLFVFNCNDDNDRDIDWQAIAVSHALTHNFTLISGGPGTGKTTTVARLIALLVVKCASEGMAPPKVKLLAPTGKAAVRLLDSIKSQFSEIEKNVSAIIEREGLKNKLGERLTLPNLLACLPDSSETIHRFLLELNALPGFERNDKGNNLATLINDGKAKKSAADVVLVDESSMIDLGLMNAFCSVIDDKTQVVMMGDPFQLPPVEPGEVFAECVRDYESVLFSQEQTAAIHSLTGCQFTDMTGSNSEADSNSPLVKLRKTYRFKGDLKEAAEYIINSDCMAFRQRFLVDDINEANNDKNKVAWFDSGSEVKLYAYLIQAYESYSKLIIHKPDLASLENTFAEFQCLCSTYEGALGVRKLNHIIEKAIVSQCSQNNKMDPKLYHGKPILITKNQTKLGVSNGDIGFVMQSEEGGFEVAFPQGTSAPIVVSIKRIEEWQPAYAMTIHKSQGSEYQRVGVVLADYAREVLSKELLYTGLTRAKESCEIWADNKTLSKAFASESLNPFTS